MRYWIKWFFPGVLFIVTAFWAGTLPNPVFALAGFLSFFTIGVTLIIEGRKKNKKTDSV